MHCTIIDQCVGDQLSSFYWDFRVSRNASSTVFNFREISLNFHCTANFSFVRKLPQMIKSVTVRNIAPAKKGINAQDDSFLFENMPPSVNWSNGSRITRWTTVKQMAFLLVQFRYDLEVTFSWRITYDPRPNTAYFYLLRIFLQSVVDLDRPRQQLIVSDMLVVLLPYTFPKKLGTRKNFAETQKLGHTVRSGFRLKIDRKSQKELFGEAEQPRCP